MDMLPRDIADLCAIRLERSARTAAPGTLSPSLSLTQGDDGVYTLTYRGDVLGWIGSLAQDRREGNTYRAISTSGGVRHCPSLKLAKDFLIAAAI